MVVIERAVTYSHFLALPKKGGEGAETMIDNVVLFIFRPFAVEESMTGSFASQQCQLIIP
jgi:hypothetical protein